MSYESTAEPIKVGYLMDFTLPPGFPEELLASFTRCFDLIFEEALEQGLIDRKVAVEELFHPSMFEISRV